MILTAPQMFEKALINYDGDNVVANRKQLQVLYDVPKRTLADQINDLKNDGLIEGATHRPKSGRPYEIYNLDEIVSIGFRLRSKRAVVFQKWAREVISEKLRQQQILAERLWDREDRFDLIPK